MSLPVELAVKLSSAKGDRHVTLDVRDLVTRWTDEGGYASCGIALDRPLTLQPDEIAYYGGTTVYDKRHGGIVWDGRQEDPGRSAGDGQVWDLTAVGGQAHTLDRTVPYILVDQRMGQDVWAPAGLAANAPHIDISYPSDDNAAIRLHARAGSTFVGGTSSFVVYRAIQVAGQQLGRVSAAWTTGITSANSSARLDTRLGAGAVHVVEADSFTVASGTLLGSRGGANAITAGDDTAILEYLRSTTNLSGLDTTWLEFSAVVVRALLKDKSGSDITTGYSADTVLASEVVADLLGRWLTQFDGANAAIVTTSYAIDQLAYPDGVTPNKVLADLMELEAGSTWRVWERNAAGKFRFEWVTIPTSVRYEADVTDGYDSQGSADGLYNRVTVRWKDPNGRTLSLVRTSTVPILDDAGLIRQGLLDLGDEVGSSAAAVQAGDQWLLDRKYPPNAGRLRIARPIVDLETGRMVMPWEIRPGLIRVRGVMPRPDALNASTRDGVTVFRIVASEFRASDGAATLELDSYAPSTARMLADLSRRPVYRRR